MRQGYLSALSENGEMPPILEIVSGSLATHPGVSLICGNYHCGQATQ